MGHAKSVGFSLAEMAVALVVIAILAVGVSSAFVYGLQVVGAAEDRVPAYNAAVRRMEELRSAAYGGFDTLALQNGVTFQVAIANSPLAEGMGSTRVVMLSPDLAEVTVTVAWRDRRRQLHGEDGNLNGQLDAGEDANANAVLDSPIQLTTRMTRR